MCYFIAMDSTHKPATQADLVPLKLDLAGLKSDVVELKSDVAEIKSDVLRLDTTLKETKTELKQDIHRLATELVRTQGQMQEMDRRLNAKMDAGFNRIMEILDSFLNKLETYARESFVIPKTLDEHGKQLKAHDRRITLLEKKA